MSIPSFSHRIAGTVAALLAVTLLGASIPAAAQTASTAGAAGGGPGARPDHGKNCS